MKNIEATAERIASKQQQMEQEDSFYPLAECASDRFGQSMPMRSRFYTFTKAKIPVIKDNAPHNMYKPKYILYILLLLSAYDKADNPNNEVNIRDRTHTLKMLDIISQFST